MPAEFDVIVVGAGPVGENAADRAHKAGLTVAIVEKHLVGGECSFYACSPSKALLRPIHATRASQRVQGSEGAHVDPQGVLARRDAWINRVGTSDTLDDSGQVGWLDHVGITLLRGEARLTGELAIEVDGKPYRARQAVVLATGTMPAVPPIPGLREANPWTNREATTSRRIPDRLAVLGGGVVACELAQVYAAIGSTVTIIELADGLLGRNEEFAGKAVAEALERDGVDLRLGTRAESVSRLGPTGEVTVQLSDGTSVTADELLVAVGRTPATPASGVEEVGGQLDDAGYVRVTERMEVEGISADQPWLYAVGDVNGQALLTHMGKYQARAVGDLIGARAAGREPDPGPPSPWAVGVGLAAGRLHRPRGRRGRAHRGRGPRARHTGQGGGPADGLGGRGRPAGRGLPGAGPDRRRRGRRRPRRRDLRRPGRGGAGARGHRRHRRQGAADDAVARRPVLPDDERDLAAAAGGVRRLSRRRRGQPVRRPGASLPVRRGSRI